jgi:zona occludens toxin (predicted ATPase)
MRAANMASEKTDKITNNKKSLFSSEKIRFLVKILTFHFIAHSNSKNTARKNTNPNVYGSKPKSDINPLERIPIKIHSNIYLALITIKD